MPHDDEIVARVPLVNFYALGALRKPNFWGEIARIGSGMNPWRPPKSILLRSSL